MYYGFIGEIRMVSWKMAPILWSECDGEILSIKQNQALHFVIGTIYGGDGDNTFALPDLRGRTPIHKDEERFRFRIGGSGGEETITLETTHLPAHSHFVRGVEDISDTLSPNQHVLTDSNPPDYIYAPPPSEESKDWVSLSSGSIASAGGGEAHENMQPYLAVNFVICVAGYKPPRNKT